jgi:hypothetical protein
MGQSRKVCRLNIAMNGDPYFGDSHGNRTLSDKAPEFPGRCDANPFKREPASLVNPFHSG